jgi:serine/threonine protein kinase
MSVSIDGDLTEGGEESRDVIASWLDDHSDGRCDAEDLREAVRSVCQRDPDAPWEALALLDQYTRRNRITPELAQSLKADIEKQVFGKNRPPPARPERAERRETAAPDDAAPRENAARESAARQTAAPDPAPTLPSSPPDSTTDLTPEPAAAPTLRRPVTETHSEPPLRKLSAERDEPSTRPGTAFIERTALRVIEEPSVDFPVAASPPPAPRRVTSSPPTPRNVNSVVGRVLRDRYELLSVLGRGPSGVVYRAVDRRRMHLSESARCVAVKLLNENYAQQPAALAELEREFHQAQSLSHPNIVSVFDLDQDGDTYFVVMELLEGQLLSSILRKLAGRPMRREHAFAIVGAVGSALAYAHGREMVHADLKPGAIMITSSGEVRVLDFGFARNRAFDLHTAAAPHETPATAPAYASVERVNGSEPAVSDDVYSLACIAYELFTGQHPFGGRSALLARANGRRPPRVRGFNHKQWSALQRALLWTRGERRIGVAELLDALEPAKAPPLSAAPEDILTPPDERSRWLRAGAWAAAVAALVGAAIYFAPDLALRSERRVDDAAPVSAPAADREMQSAPDAAPEATNPEPVAPPAKQTAKAPAASTPAGDKPKAAAGAPPARKASSGATPAAVIEFEKDTYVTNEGDGSVRLEVTRNGSVRGPARFSWSIRGNSAEAGADFAAIGPVSEEIPSGVRSASLTIPLVSDGVVENTELFLVELQVAGGESLGERSHAAVIIVDDD